MDLYSMQWGAIYIKKFFWAFTMNDIVFLNLNLEKKKLNSDIGEMYNAFNTGCLKGFGV